MPGPVGRLSAAIQELRDYPGPASRLIARRLIFDRLHHLARFVGVESGGLMFLADTRDGFIGRPLFTRSAPAESAYLRLAVALASPRRSLLVDVGANTGTTSILAVGQLGFARAVAFEPSARSLPVLRANVALNGMEDSVLVVPLALGAAAGRAALDTSGRNPGDDHIAPGGNAEVQVARLDEALAAAGIGPPDVGMLWIDVQGYEPQVLQGAGRYLECRPPTVIEFWPEGLKRCGGEDALFRVVADTFEEVTDLRESQRLGRPMTLRASRIRELASRYAGSAYTDLLLR